VQGARPEVKVEPTAESRRAPRKEPQRDKRKGEFSAEAGLSLKNGFGAASAEKTKHRTKGCEEMLIGKLLVLD
jgi:hypothetical protein